MEPNSTVPILGVKLFPIFILPIPEELSKSILKKSIANLLAAPSIFTPLVSAIPAGIFILALPYISIATSIKFKPDGSKYFVCDRNGFTPSVATVLTSPDRAVSSIITEFPILFS